MIITRFTTRSDLATKKRGLFYIRTSYLAHTLVKIGTENKRHHTMMLLQMPLYAPSISSTLVF